MSFQKRSYKKELLDRQDIPFEDIQRNMQELNFINQHLGGHAITVEGVKKLISQTKKEWHIAEIGCGGGDNLQAIKKWSEKNKIDLRLTGVDINRECIRFAALQAANKGIQFICSDYKTTQFQSPPDIIFSSLFCHHFIEADLVQMLHWMYKNSSTGYFINDLHRHRFAYFSIKLLTSLFSKSYLVKNDAPLSVKRGFVKREWERIFLSAGIKTYEIEWKWAFRWLILCRK